MVCATIPLIYSSATHVQVFQQLQNYKANDFSRSLLNSRLFCKADELSPLLRFSTVLPHVY